MAKNSKEVKPTKTEIPNSVSELLVIDKIQGIITDFTAEDIVNTTKLVIIFEDKAGSVWVRHSCNEMNLFKLVALAWRAVLNDDNCEGG